MRSGLWKFSVCLLLTLSGVSIGCSPAQPGAGGGADPGNNPIVISDNTPKADPDFPLGWDKWEQLNEVTREGAGELRALYANPKAKGAPYDQGASFVKAHYRLNAGGKGELFQLSVMRKTGAGGTGWTWEAFAPDGTRRTADAEVCVMCHTQRAEQDYIFSER